MNRRVTAAPDPLSKREVEVVHLVVEGLSDEQIAGRLHISRGTAKTHVANARRKLGARSRTQLAAFALRHRIVPLSPRYVDGPA
jgi:DNA-binding NarL/FixJ family response regulator